MMIKEGFINQYQTKPVKDKLTLDEQTENELSNCKLTKNGEIIGFTDDYFDTESISWFPAVSLKAKNAKIEINFGKLPFNST